MITTRPQEGTILTHDELLDLLDVMRSQDHWTILEAKQRYTDHQLNLFLYIIFNATERGILPDRYMFHNVNYIVAHTNLFTIVPHINAFDSKN